MNKRGNIFFGVVIGIFLFAMGVLFIPFLTDDITTSRTALNCSTPTNITGGVMLTCLLGDLLVPYFIWFFISLLIGYIIGN